MEKNHSAKAGSHPANRRPPGTKDVNKVSGSSPSGVEIVIKDIKSMYETAKSNKEVMGLDLKALIDHIKKRLQFYQKEKTGKPSKLWHRFCSRVKDLFSNGMKQFASGSKGLISCSEAAKVATDLFDRVQDSNEVLTTAFVIVSYILDGFQDLSDNKEECLRLLDEMITLGEFVNNLNIGETTALKKKHMEKSIVMIMEGSLLCCSFMTSSKIGQFFKAKANKDELSDLKEKVKLQYTHIDVLTETLIHHEVYEIHRKVDEIHRKVDEIHRKVYEDQHTRLPELNVYPKNAEADDKDKAYHIFREEIERGGGQIFKGDDLAELVVYNNLPKHLIDPFLDICSYFRGYRWHVVENIVGISILNQLKKRSLVKNNENLVTVPDIFLKLGTLKSKGTRIIGTSEISHHLNRAKRNKDIIHSIKGLWFKQDKDGCPISARKLDPVSSSLRVLGLEGSRRTITEDNYDITFPELIYIWAGINPLPFDVSKLKKLQSLAYSPQNPEELNLKMPISLKQLWLNGELYSLDYIDLHQRFKTPLTNLRSLTFAHFHQLKELPKELGSHENLISLEIIDCANFVEFPENLGLPLLRYLKLSSCKSLKKLPKASELKRLDTLLLSGCKKLQELCNNFKDLQSLEYLSLSACPMLEASCMEVIVNMKNLKVVDIRGSKMLLEKWRNMESPNLTRSFRVITGKV